MSDMEEELVKYDDFIKKIAYITGLKVPFIHNDDALQAAYIGFMDAYKKYDESKGASFKTYLSIRIKGAIIDESRKQNPFGRRNHEREMPFTQHQFEDSEDFLAAEDNEKDDNFPEIEEIIQPLYRYEHRKILMDIYGKGITEMEIANELGVSESRISQMKKEALSILKMMYKTQGKDFGLSAV